MSKKKENRENLNKLLSNSVSLLEKVEPRKYLFPEFYKKVNEHLESVRKLKRSQGLFL